MPRPETAQRVLVWQSQRGPRILVHAGKLQRLVQCPVRGNFHVGLYAGALPAFAGIGIEGAPHWNEGGVAFAHRRHPAEMRAAARGFSDQCRAMRAL